MRRNWSELPKKGNPKVRMSAAAKIGPTMPNIETVFATKYPSATFVRGPPAHEDLWGGVICDPVGFSQHK